MDARVNMSMEKLIRFAYKTNPIWPFASVILDDQGRELVWATDCAHISPLYHSESLAIHALCTDKQLSKMKNLTLISTCEPDSLSMSTLYWAGVIQELKVKHVFFGLPLCQLMTLWPFGIDINARTLIGKAQPNQMTIHAPILTEKVYQLFRDALERQKRINQEHPAFGNLSNSCDDFYSFTYLE